MKKAGLFIVLLAIIMAGGWLVRYLILGSSVISLSKDPANVAVISSIKQSSPDLIVGKDYKIQSVKYFHNKQWVVVSVQPIGAASDPGIEVLKLENGQYKVVLGPANSWLGVDLSGLPQDVSDYINPPVEE